MVERLSLYYAPLSCASVPYMVLTEARIDFNVVDVNLGAQQNLTVEFERLNPKRKVPVLVVDDEPLTENVAILIWIARRFPDAKLIPRDWKQEFSAISFLAWCASTIHPALTPNARPLRYCDIPGSESSVRRCAQEMLAAHFSVAEAALRDCTWFFDDHYTVADAYFYWAFRRAVQFELDVTGFPRCRDHLHRMEQRESTQRLLAHEAKIIAAFAQG